MSVNLMLISILSVSVKALEMSCAEATQALAPQAWELKPENLCSHLHLIWDLGSPNLSCT